MVRRGAGPVLALLLVALLAPIGVRAGGLDGRIPACLPGCDVSPGSDADCCRANPCLDTVCATYQFCIAKARATRAACLEREPECARNTGGRCTLLVQQCVAPCLVTFEEARQRCRSQLRALTEACPGCTVRNRRERVLASRVCNSCTGLTTTTTTSTSTTSTTTSTTATGPTTTTLTTTTTTSTVTSTTRPASVPHGRCFDTCVRRIKGVRDCYASCRHRCNGNNFALPICEQACRLAFCPTIKARCAIGGLERDDRNLRCCRRTDSCPSTDDDGVCD